MTYYLEHSEWVNSTAVPEGMNLKMINHPNRLDTLLKPELAKMSLNNIVMDMGAGTGILGMYALEHGASFVYFVERDPQMFHILSNVLPKKIDPGKYKLINKDIEELDASDFENGLPDVVISEFYGPRLFDEGYVNYVKHVKSFSPNSKFIPECFNVDFYYIPIDLSHPIWPQDETLVDHFKFMYSEKGFAQHIEYDFSKLSPLGKITYDTNTQKFDNDLTLVHSADTECLLIGKATIMHGVTCQYYTTLGWYMDPKDIGKTFKIYYDTENYFNPRKIEVNVQ